VAANDPSIVVTLGSPLFVWSLKTILPVVVLFSLDIVWQGRSIYVLPFSAVNG
jgi:hypothetical protein